jgi:hypothetical protein
MRLWSLRCPNYAGSFVYRRLQPNREGYSGLVESVGMNIDERSRDDHRSSVWKRERGRCLRTKHKAIAKSNATGWYSLTARELHTGVFEFSDWGLHDVRATCRFKGVRSSNASARPRTDGANAAHL